MKFWELTSAFRSETDNLKSVLLKDSWTKFKSHYDNLNEIIQRQDRQILDEEIPFQLAKEVRELSKLKFYLYYKNTPYRLTTWKQGTDEPFEEISSLDILLRFGGSYIEETLERSISDVLPRQLGNNIEVLGAFNLTNIGMLAFLRTENSILTENEIISSFDNSRVWTVIKEPFMFVNPYSAYEKQERQKEQGIRQYIIKPIVGTDKPFDTEILKRNTNDTETA
ncbi:hypothetical protein [Terrimonas pollutisoli]|uniref:hypothetical protein n=1 Tax=Terrimonas pollutisoli TaxID=3034147 RepID=UPI0023EB603F|nr:hypothetical protein [Terrimonas sp. H1YJ31]